MRSHDDPGTLKPYHSPHLLVYGTLREVTASGPMAMLLMDNPVQSKS